MEIIKTSIDGLLLIKPRIFQDERGYFMESFKESFIRENLPGVNFIQDNESESKKGVVRGLHFQSGKYQQAKLVRALEGEILDVVVDVRTSSPTFLKKYEIILSSKNKNQLFVPRGFLHGFSVLSDFARVLYKVDNLYSPDHETGVLFNDLDLDINWKVKDPIVSGKDLTLETFKSFINKNLKP